MFTAPCDHPACPTSLCKSGLCFIQGCDAHQSSSTSSVPLLPPTESGEPGRAGDAKRATVYGVTPPPGGYFLRLGSTTEAMPPLRPSFPMILLLAAHVAVLSGAGLAKASMPSGEVRTAWHRALLASGHKTHHAHKGATRGPNLTNLGMPALDGASGPFRRMEITNELDYAQAIDNLLGPTREPDELLKPLCDEACTRHNYRHIRTPPSAVQALKILVVLDRFVCLTNHTHPPPLSLGDHILI